MLKFLRRNIILLMVFSLFAGSNALAQRPNRSTTANRENFHEKRKAEMNKIMEEIGISSEQQEKLELQRKKHMEEFKAIHEELRNKEKELRSVLKNKDVDMAEVERIKKELLELRAKDIDQKTEGTLLMKEVLTEEQFDKLSEKIEEQRKSSNSKRDRFKKGDFRRNERPDSNPGE